MLNKNDPLIGAVQEVMKRNQAEREAVKLVNEKFGVSDRKALPHEKQGAWDAAYKQVLSEGLHPNQQKLDVHEPEKDKLTKHDFKMLRAKKKPVEEDVTSPSSMGIQKPDYASGTPDYAKSKEQTVNRAAKTSLPAGTMKEEEQIDEKAPPGAKYERMVKHIKSKMAKGGLTKKEKSIAYATAWKAKKKSDVNEGFNDRHDSSVTASDENQVVADQLNEAGGVNLSARPKRVVSSGNQKFVQNPFTSRGQIGRDYKTQAQSLRTKAGIATGKYAKARPTPGTGGYSATGNYTFNKLKDQAQTAALAATGNVTDLIGITDPKKSAGLRTFNPGAERAGNLIGVGTILVPGRAPVAAASTAAKVKQGTSIIPNVAKTGGQGARIAGRKPGVNAGPWGTPSTAAAKAATTSAEKFKARANAIRRQVAGADEVKPTPVSQATATTNGSSVTTPNAAAANAARVARTNARPTTPNAAAANASRLRMAVNKTVNTTVNTARLVGGPNGPSSGSSFGAPSPAAAATTSPTVKARQQLAAVGNQTGGVNKITDAGTKSTPPAKTAPAPAPAPTKTKQTVPATQPVRKVAPQDSSTLAQRAQFNRQIDKGNAAPGTQYKGLGVTTGTTSQQKPMAINKRLPGK